MTKYALSFTTALAIALPTIAQEDPGVEEFIITGTRIPTALEHAVTAVSLITAEDIEVGQFRLLSDALQLSPGVQVNRSGSFGSVTSVSIRGLPSELTKIVVDGVELNDPSSFENGFDFANLDTGDVERIEILRGAQSTLYGSDAIGGVINVVTRAPAQGLEGHGYVEGGSFGTVRGSASVRGGVEKLRAVATLSGARTSGISSADKANGNPERDGSRYINFSSKLRFEPVEGVSFDGILRYRDIKSEFDDVDFFLGPIDADNVTFSEELVGAGALTLETGILSNRLSFAYNQIDRRDEATFPFDGQGERLTYEYQGTLKAVDYATLVFGAERESDTSLVREGFGASDEIHITSGFALAQVEPTYWLSLSFGLRHDANSRFGNETTANGGGVVRLPFDIRLRGSYQEGFRAPTTSELSFNPNLRSELSSGWDIGLEHNFWEERAQISVTYFHQSVIDLIAFDLATFNFVNLEAFESEGVEIASVVEVLESLSFKGAYTYTDAQNLTTDSRALRQPKNRASITVNYQPIDALTLSSGIYFNGRELDVGDAVLKRYTTLSLRASYRIEEHLEVFGRVENATDTDYQDIDGFGTPGASAYAGVRARF